MSSCALNSSFYRSASIRTMTFVCFPYELGNKSAILSLSSHHVGRFRLKQHKEYRKCIEEI